MRHVCAALKRRRREFSVSCLHLPQDNGSVLLAQNVKEGNKGRIEETRRNICSRAKKEKTASETQVYVFLAFGLISR